LIDVSPIPNSNSEDQNSS